MIIVRTLLFLAGLIWMQHLMVRRVLAVETTSRRHFAGRHQGGVRAGGDGGFSGVIGLLLHFLDVQAPG